MANRSLMHQIGYASNKNQAFSQGRVLQGARAVYQAGQNTGTNQRMQGTSAGQLGARPDYLTSAAGASRVTPNNPILSELRTSRGTGVAQQASYGPDNNRAISPTVNPIIPQFTGTFQPVNPITQLPTSVAGGANSSYGTEKTPAPPAPPAPVAPTPTTPAPPEQSTPEPNGGGGSGSGVGSVPAGTPAPKLTVGYMGQTASGFDRSSVKGAIEGTDNFLNVTVNGRPGRMRISQMDDQTLAAAMKRADNQGFIADGWIWTDAGQLIRSTGDQHAGWMQAEIDSVNRGQASLHVNSRYPAVRALAQQKLAGVASGGASGGGGSSSGSSAGTAAPTRTNTTIRDNAVGWQKGNYIKSLDGTNYQIVGGVTRNGRYLPLVNKPGGGTMIHPAWQELG